MTPENLTPPDLPAGEIKMRTLNNAYVDGFHAGVRRARAEYPLIRVLERVVIFMLGMLVGGTGAFFMGLWT